MNKSLKLTFLYLIIVLVVGYFISDTLTGYFSYDKNIQTRLQPVLGSAETTLSFQSAGQPEFVKGEFIVKFKPQKSPIRLSKSAGKVITRISSIDNLNTRYKVNDFRQLLRHKQNVQKLANIYSLKVPGETDILKTVEEYKKDPNVEYAEPDYIVSVAQVQGADRIIIDPNSEVGSGALFIPNDPLYPVQWGFRNIHAEEGWAIEAGNPSVVIADIDTGVDYTHEDLAANMWVNIKETPYNGIDDDNNGYIDDYRGWDFVECNLFASDGSCSKPKTPDSDPMDDHGHGTHTAGTIAAVTNNGIGVAGTCWNCKIMPLKFLNKQGSGESTWAANAVIYAADNGAKITSNSWGVESYSRLLRDAFNYAYDKGTLSVAAAGNDNTNSIEYPAFFENIISVAAIDTGDNKASFSNYGTRVDVAAPGMKIYSTVPKGTCSICTSSGYKSISGTSMATPHVSGMAGLLLSQNPEMKSAVLREAIRHSVDKFGTDINALDKYIGTGRINIQKALSLSSVSELKSIITAPTDYPIVRSSSNFFVYGTAEERYKLSLSNEPYSNTWQVVSQGDSGIRNLRLGIINFNEHTMGVKYLKLEVTANSGAVNEDITSLELFIPGVLYVTSIPTGADVYLGNTFKGETPRSIKDLYPSSYLITLKKRGHQTYKESVSITSGVTTNLQATLIPLPIEFGDVNGDYLIDPLDAREIHLHLLGKKTLPSEALLRANVIKNPKYPNTVDYYDADAIIHYINGKTNPSYRNGIYPTSFPIMIGDVNLNGEIDSDDINKILEITLNPASYSNNLKFAADLDANGALNNLDVNAFQNPDLPWSKPILANPGPQKGVTNQMLQFAINSKDIDGDLLSISGNLPTGAMLTPFSYNQPTQEQSWFFSWTPNAVGIYSVEYTVTDNDINTNSVSHQIEVFEPGCGNNIRDGPEICDGTDLANQSCQKQGFFSGTLSCKSDCSGFNTLECLTNQNVIRNGDFSSGTSQWVFYTNGAGSFSVQNGEARIAITADGSNVQLYQTPVALQGSAKYRLSFRARHTASKPITVSLIKHFSPYTNYGLSSSFTLTQSMQDYSPEFTATPGDKTDARLMFYLPNADVPGSNFYFDDIRLVRI